MGFKFNPLTGQFDIGGSSSTSTPGPSGSPYTTEQVVVSSAQATAKAINLSQTPTDPTATLLLIKGGPNQFLGDDYNVSGGTLTWNGLGLDGVLDVGDKLTIVYYV